MEATHFHLPDHEPEARLARLHPTRLEALEKALSRLSTSALMLGRTESDQDALPLFLLPMAEFGLTCEQMVRLAERMPAELPLDHRIAYFDFRLDIWIRHIEPPTIAECLEEYFGSADSPEQGMAYLREQWQAFLRSHGAA